MASSALQVVGFILGVLSWAGMIATCASPEWRKNSHGQTLIDNTLRYDGLWVRCKAFSTGQTSCKSYNSFFIGLPEVLQICRALMIAALVFGFVAIIITIVGMKCTNISPGNQKAKAIVSMIGGLLFGIAAIFVGAAVSYYAHGVVQEYYNPILDEDTPMHLRFQYGVALFIGWASLVLGILGGVSLMFVSVFIILRLNANSNRQLRHKSHAATLLPASKASTSMHSKHQQKQNSIPFVIQHAPHNKPGHSTAHEHQKHHNQHSSIGKNGSLNSDASKQRQDNRRTSKSKHEHNRNRSYNNTDNSRNRDKRRRSHTPDRPSDKRQSHPSATGRKEYV